MTPRMWRFVPATTLAVAMGHEGMRTMGSAVIGMLQAMNEMLLTALLIGTVVCVAGFATAALDMAWLGARSLPEATVA